MDSMRRPILLMVALLMSVSATISLAGDGVELAAHRLFHIERNKNANIVVYDAMALPDTTLPEDDPVTVYWLKLAEGGHRKNLKGIERKMAYGFSVKERKGDRLILDMKADIGRPVVVEKHEGAFKAFIEIGEKSVILEKVYIFAVERFPYPSVKYLELFGRDPVTGEESYEKFEP